MPRLRANRAFRREPPLGSLAKPGRVKLYSPMR